MPLPHDLRDRQHRSFVEVPLAPPGGPDNDTAQRVVLYDANGPIPWPTTLGQDSAANSLPVVLATNQPPIPVAGRVLRPSANPVLTVAASYASGDYVGTSNQVWLFPGAFRPGGPGTGILHSALLIDKAAQSISTELWLFSQPVAVPADSAAWDITDANAQFLLGVIPFSTYYASASNSVAPVAGLGLPVWATGQGDTNLYGGVVTRGAPSYTTGDLTVVLAILAD